MMDTPNLKMQQGLTYVFAIITFTLITMSGYHTYTNELLMANYYLTGSLVSVIFYLVYKLHSSQRRIMAELNYLTKETKIPETGEKEEKTVEEKTEELKKQLEEKMRDEK